MLEEHAVEQIENEAGEVVQLYGRKITEGLRKGTPLHLYLPGAHRGVWNRAALDEHREIILCELNHAGIVEGPNVCVAGARASEPLAPQEPRAGPSNDSEARVAERLRHRIRIRQQEGGATFYREAALGPRLPTRMTDLG